MKNILVAMDISDASVNVLKYALLAAEDANIHIVHVWGGASTMQEPLTVAAEQSKETLVKKTLESLIRNQIGYTHIPKHMSIHIVAGEVVSQISKFVTGQSIDTVFIGSRDTYDMLDRWFGTITLGVVRKVGVPVYVIPPKAKFLGFKKVLVASDEHMVEKKHLDFLRKWNDKRQAFMTFLHIELAESDDFDSERQQIITEYYEKEEMSFGFEISTMQHGNVAEALLTKSLEFSSDLVIVASVGQNYLQSLLFQTVTEELILVSSVPMLFVAQ